MADFTYVDGDDWMGLYSDDGELIYQGHSMHILEFFRCVGMSCDHKGMATDEFGGYPDGHLPDLLEDLIEGPLP